MIGLKSRTGGFLRAGAFAAACLTAFALSSESEAQNYPSEPLEWTIAFGPGGGNDIMSRTLIDILEKYELYPEDMATGFEAGDLRGVFWLEFPGEAQ